VLGARRLPAIETELIGIVFAAVGVHLSRR
jgi:hypothetical protein